MSSEASPNQKSLLDICSRIALNEPLSRPTISVAQSAIKQQIVRIAFKELNGSIPDLRFPSATPELAVEELKKDSLSDFIAQLPRYYQDVNTQSESYVLTSRILPPNLITHEPRVVACGFVLWLIVIDGRYLKACGAKRTITTLF